MRMRRGSACAALVKKHNAVAVRIEETAVPVLTTRARAAVQKEHRQTAGIAALLHIQHMRRRHRESMRGIRLNVRVERVHGDSSIKAAPNKVALKAIRDALNKSLRRKHLQCFKAVCDIVNPHHNDDGGFCALPLILP
jgi:iron-sulfur cluster repair protein YtfE (RIC family)